MKTHILTIVLLMCTAGLYAQNVGIGLNNPTVKLHVSEGVKSDHIILGNNTMTSTDFYPSNGAEVYIRESGLTGDENMLVFDKTGGVAFGMGVSDLGPPYDLSELALQIKFVGGASYNYNTSTGDNSLQNEVFMHFARDSRKRIGVWTTNPSTEFDVNGQIRMRSGSNAGYLIQGDANGVMSWADPNSLFNTDNEWHITGNAGTNPSTHFLGTTDLNDMVFRTNNTERIRLMADGDVGIGTDTPSNKLDINGDATLRGGTLHIWPSDAATQEGGQINLMKHGTAANGPTGSWAIDVFENDFRILNNDQVSPVAEFIRIDDVSGNVGIGTVSPASKLDVVGDISVNTPFKFKLKNGADVDNYLMYEPTVDGLRINGRDAVFITTSDITNATNGQDLVVRDGRVGINTNTPSRGLLHVNGNYPNDAGGFTYYAFPGEGCNFGACGGPVDASIYATNRIQATEFNAFSDARIKDIQGISNSARDLSILKQIEITDYSMKDRAKGDNIYKKVIAQQVEKVYPIAVTKITDVIPDVYKLSSCKNGLIQIENNLKVGDRIRLLFEDQEVIEEVIAANAKMFQIASNKTGEVFVYGREVDDFRVVDYEAISMLNVSATQALANELDKLKEENAALKRKNEELNSRVEQNSADIELLKVAMGQASK